jgi:hypothetical protein
MRRIGRRREGIFLNLSLGVLQKPVAICTAGSHAVNLIGNCG